jgi:glutamate-1-semialdehyde 2,1-aminomutase
MPSEPIDRDRLRALTDRELATFADRHPRSAAAYAGAGHLFGRVPMTWMNKTVGGFPLYVDRARGARLIDIDGHEYVDFCLGTPGPWPATPPPRWWRR